MLSALGCSALAGGLACCAGLAVALVSGAGVGIYPLVQKLYGGQACSRVPVWCLSTAGSCCLAHGHAVLCEGTAVCDVLKQLLCFAAQRPFVRQVPVRGSRCCLCCGTLLENGATACLGQATTAVCWACLHTGGGGRLERPSRKCVCVWLAQVMKSVR